MHQRAKARGTPVISRPTKRNEYRPRDRPDISWIPRGFPLGRGSIVNLIGTPGSGKSTILTGLQIEHVALKIDDYRRRLHDNEIAWTALVRDAWKSDKLVVIESSGLSRAVTALKELSDKEKRKWLDIYIFAEHSDLISRVKDRPKTRIQGMNITISDMIRDGHEKTTERYPNALVINTSKLSIEESRKLFDEAVRSMAMLG